MQTDTPDDILRINTVLKRTGLSRSITYRKMGMARSRETCGSAPGASDGASPPSVPDYAIRCSIRSTNREAVEPDWAGYHRAGRLKARHHLVWLRTMPRSTIQIQPREIFA